MKWRRQQAPPALDVWWGIWYRGEKDKGTQGLGAAIPGPAVTEESCDISQHIPSLGLDFPSSVLPIYPGDTVVKEPPARAGDAGDRGPIPGWDVPLEEEMATHSSILAWEIPWTEEPGRLQSVGSQRVGHS